MRTLEATFSYTYNNEENTREIELNEDSTEETVRQEIAEALEEMAQDERGEDEEGKEITAAMIVLTDVECSEAEDSATLTDIFDFANAYCQCDQDADVVSAAIYLGIEPDSIDEAYNGHYSSDEDFAIEMAYQLGAYEKHATWPNNCIDWEYAAKELMYDYSEHKGEYFRKL